MRDQKQKTSINALPHLAPLEKLILNKNKLYDGITRASNCLISYTYIHLFRKNQINE